MSGLPTAPPAATRDRHVTPADAPGNQGPSMLESSVRLAIAVGTWSLSPLLIYESRGIADAPILALYAVVIGAFLAFLVVCVTGIRKPVETIRGLRNRRKWLLEAALLGLAAFVAYPLLYFSAIQSGPPAAVNLVNYLWPVFAVIVVAIFRAADRSLEAGLAAGFGFAGAGLAITVGSEVGSAPSTASELYPFLLAAMGAVVYGGASGAISLRHPIRRKNSLMLFTTALLLGGLVSALLLGILSLFHPQLTDLDLTGNRAWALIGYSAFLPVAHLSWMNAVRDKRVPAFSTAFLVPVISTGILTLVLAGVAKPGILSALVLVLCGILFSNVSDKGVPVGYAVSLAMLSSVLVSQILAGEVTAETSSEIGTISELIAAVAAIFAGFVLSNAIQRNGALHTACSRFYARAAAVAEEEPLEDVTAELDSLDGRVILEVGKPARANAARDPKLRRKFASEWAEVDVAVSNGVSAYEWLVLLVGGGSLILAFHAFAAGSSLAVMIILRALAVALVVGILFAIRDYDRHRPQGLCDLLESFRMRYEFPIDAGSPLSDGARYWSSGNPISIRLGLAFLLVVAICAIVLNG